MVVVAVPLGEVVEAPDASGLTGLNGTDHRISVDRQAEAADVDPRGEGTLADSGEELRRSENPVEGRRRNSGGHTPPHSLPALGRSDRLILSVQVCELMPFIWEFGGLFGGVGDHGFFR